MPRFVFWDCDNTLIENENLHWRKHKSVLEQHGYDLPDDVQKIFFHNNGGQNWEWMAEHIGLTIPRDEYLKEIDTWYHTHIHEVPIRSGVLSALEFFRGSGAKQCVVTNARRTSVEPMLVAKSLNVFFEFAWCKEDYTARKPDPMPYLSAKENMAKLLGCEIDEKECLAIEDAPEGVEAAHGAGFSVIQRRLKENDSCHPDADFSVFGEGEFLAVIKGL